MISIPSYRREKKKRKSEKEYFLPFLPNDDGILFQVAHIDGGTLLDYIGMFANHQPAHMREKESSLRVMGIRVRVRKFVMHSMVSNPLVDMILATNVRFIENLEMFGQTGNRIDRRRSLESEKNGRLTWKAMVWKIIRMTRNGHFAL